MTTSIKVRLTILFLVLGCTVGCDQASKHIARRELGHLNSVALPGGFGELRLAGNHGSFLSLGSSLSPSARQAFFIGGVGIGLIALFGYLVMNSNLTKLSFAGLSLVLAGGISNLIDRVMQHGAVTDFIYLRAGPLQTGVFNVADMVIMLGIGMVVLTLWKRPNSSDSSGAAQKNKAA